MREIRKSTYREIKSSFGRFMAIFAIVAMGVGFFAGLKVTKEAMLATVREYLERHAFYDFRLLSTLGFEEEDVAHLAQAGSAEGREPAVEGSVSFDVLYRLEDGTQGAVKAYSLTERVNTLKLLSGRLPQGADECVADAGFMGAGAVGSVLYLSEDNEEEDLEHFAQRAYKVVGIVQSPLYLQYERGNTSLGTGRLDGFVYLSEDGFDVDYYTEIYVKFPESYPLYSGEYDAFIDEKETVWETLTESAAHRRYQEIWEEADAELKDAEKELEDKKAEGEQELADAAQTLADAKEELADGERAIADAKEELADGERTLAQKKRELADAEETLREKEQELADARKVVDEAAEDLAQGEQKFLDGRWEWKQGVEAMEAAKLELAQNRAALEAQAAELSGQRENLQAAAQAGLISQQELEAGLAQIAAGEQALSVYFAQLSAGETELAAGEEELSAAGEALAAAEKELEAGRADLAAAEEELAEGGEALEDGKTQLQEGREALRDGEAELADARKTLEEKEQELLDAQREYADGEQEYRDAQREFHGKIAEAEGKIADAREELSELSEPDTYVLGRETNVGYVCFENDSNIIEGIANVFPLFFFLVAALVCITTMNRMVEEQRTQIGVLKALGYGERTIMGKYVTYSGLAAVSGCVAGFFLGTWGFPRIIWFCYGIMYRADEIFYVFDWRLAAVSLAVSLLCSIGTTWLSCRVELSQVAAALMRPKAPRAGKRVFLERIPFVWKRLGFLRKVSLRNIFRYKKRLFMMVLGISGCTALLVTGFGIKDSIADVGEMQFREIQTYEIGISYKEDVDEADEEKLEALRSLGIDNYTSVMEKNMDFVSGEGVKSVILVAGEGQEMPDFVKLRTMTGEEIPYPAVGEAVISNKLADVYKIKPGDMITLRDGEMRTISVKVSGVYKNYIYDYVHISGDTWRELTGEEPERRTVYLNLEEGAQTAHELSAELMKQTGVTNVTVNADTMERFNTMLESLNIIVVVVIICAAGLAFIVLYNLTNINITERVREIATIKVLGFYKRETASYVFRENMMLTALGLVAGLFLGQILHRYVISQIQVDMVKFDTYIKPVSYLYSGILTLVFAWFVDLAMGGKLEGISMTESLKSVD